MGTTHGTHGGKKSRAAKKAISSSSVRTGTTAATAERRQPWPASEGDCRAGSVDRGKIPVKCRRTAMSTQYSRSLRCKKMTENECKAALSLFLSLCRPHIRFVPCLSSSCSETNPFSWPRENSDSPLPKIVLICASFHSARST